MRKPGELFIARGKVHVLAETSFDEDPAGLECEEYKAVCGVESQSWSMPAQNIQSAEFIASLEDGKKEGAEKCLECFDDEKEGSRSLEPPKNPDEDRLEAALQKMVQNRQYHLATKEILIEKEELSLIYPFMRKILALEESIISDDNIVILEGVINPELLERKSHYTEYRHDDGLPAYRIYSKNPLMPDKEGPVPTYAVTGRKVTKLGLQRQIVDPGYVADGYNGEARLNPNPLSIQEELTIKKVEDPDFIVCRERKGITLKFEMYRRAENLDEFGEDIAENPADAPLFGLYEKRVLLKLPHYREFLEKPLCSTTCLFEEEDGPFNTRFKDLEEITYFYNFSSVNLLRLNRNEAEKFLILQERGENKKSIGEQLQQLIRDGKRVTHIVRSTEEYGGDTNYSVWRKYLEAQICEVK